MSMFEWLPLTQRQTSLWVWNRILLRMCTWVRSRASILFQTSYAGSDRAFTNFKKKLNGFLNVFLPQNGIPLPDSPGRVLHLKAKDQITEFQFLRVTYESMVDWRMRQDLLRCNPTFFGSPRFDCVIVKTAGKPFIAHLVYLFGCSISDADLHLAIIHPYDVGIGVRRRRDVDLGLWRVRATPCSSSEIISVQSII